MKLIIDRAIGFFGVSTHFTTSAGNDPTDSAADTAGTDETRFAPPAFASGSPASISVSDPNPRVFKISEDGTVLKQKDSTLIFGTLQGEFSADGSTNALLCNLAQDVSQQEDATINSDLRNLLHDFHDVGDLAAIDILRERDLGIATLNQTGGIRTRSIYLVRPDYQGPHADCRAKTGLRHSQSDRNRSGQRPAGRSRAPAATAMRPAAPIIAGAMLYEAQK